MTHPWPRRLAAVSFLAAAFAFPDLSFADVGYEVRFGLSSAGGLWLGGSRPSPGVLFESEDSEPVRGLFDTVLLQGTLKDARVRFEVARRDARGVWSPWVPFEVHRRGGGRFWARAVFPSMAGGTLKLRVKGPAEVARTSVEILSMEAFPIQESEGEARGAAPEPAPPGPRAPAPRPRLKSIVPDLPGLYRRESWSARPPKEEYAPHAPVRATQHHSAGLMTFTEEDSLKEVLFLQEYHQSARGWSDIGYHFLIDGSGRVFEGRPIDVVGAHVRANNTGNVGIALLGYYHAPCFLPVMNPSSLGDPRRGCGHEINEKQFKALAALGNWLRTAHGINPADYHGHRDYKATACPGDNIYNHLGAIRASFGAMERILGDAGERAREGASAIMRALFPSAAPSPQR